MSYLGWFEYKNTLQVLFQVCYFLVVLSGISEAKQVI